ncbi:MAG: hypothetical protein ABSG76_16515, partial [Xanthobacteraceae bacterium]
MRRITVLAAAGAAMVAVGAGAYMVGRVGRAPVPATASGAPKAADADLVTGSTAQRPAPPTAQLNAPPAASVAVAAPSTGATAGRTVAAEPASLACRGNPDAL